MEQIYGKVWLKKWISWENVNLAKLRGLSHPCPPFPVPPSSLGTLHSIVENDWNIETWIIFARDPTRDWGLEFSLFSDLLHWKFRIDSSEGSETSAFNELHVVIEFPRHDLIIMQYTLQGSIARSIVIVQFSSPQTSFLGWKQLKWFSHRPYIAS
jgi:hypothetical protein